MDTKHIPELDRQGLRKFGLTTGAMIVALFGGLFPWLLEASFPLWPWIILGVLGLMAIVAPSGLGPVYKVWMRFGLLLSKVMTPLILGIVFFGVVLPMGLIMRLLGKDPMAREISADIESYRVLSTTHPDDSIERPF